MTKFERESLNTLLEIFRKELENGNLETVTGEKLPQELCKEYSEKIETISAFVSMVR